MNSGDIVASLTAALADRYTIERELGAGGMATVYLAHDVKHDRKVAVKVLRPELAAMLGAERFLNEIKVTANLQHPHILPLHDSGRADGRTGGQADGGSPGEFLYYVMPFVEGESLRDKLIREKQLSIEESIKITESVASALDYAHRQNVIHRDIKPENILLHDGQPVVADFGISLAVSAAGGARLTETGLSLGTPQYMSPEQATGDRDVDGRSDIYSLACVLYEMLSGEPPHTGPTVQAVIAKVVTDRPRPITELRDTVPHHVAASVHKALAKLPADRFTGAADFSKALTSPGAAPFDTVPYETDGLVRLSVGDTIRWPVVLALVALALIVGIGVGWWVSSPGETSESTVRFTMNGSPRVDAWASGGKLALSPDGKTIAYVADTGSTRASSFNPARRLYRRSLNALALEPIENTEGASWPCFSPDGQWIAFVRGDDLLKVAVDGGPALKIADIGARGVRGISWAQQDILVFALDGLAGLARIGADGEGLDTILTETPAAAGGAFRWPAALPNGRGALVTVWAGDPENAAVGVVDFETGVFMQVGTGVRASLFGDNHLVYNRQDGLMLAASFDQQTLEAGSPVPVVEGVTSYLGGAAQYAVSMNGTLVYQLIETWNKTLALVDRLGRAEPLPIVRNFSWAEPPRVSPSGDYVALTIGDGNDMDIWLHDVNDRSISVLATEGSNRFPNWTPDGTRLTFASTRSGIRNLFWQPTDGSGAAEPLVTDSLVLWSSDWSPDGRTLVFQRLSSAGSGHDIFLLDVAEDSVPRPLLNEGYDERRPRISPNGRWIAYVSDEADNDNVYVRPFPDGGRKVSVSVDGGNLPVWSRDGRELFYRSGADMVAARVTSQGEFRVLERTTLFTGTHVGPGFDVLPDGEHFVMFMPEEERPSKLVVITNFLAEVKERFAALAGER